jgi:hypothetical protein
VEESDPIDWTLLGSNNGSNWTTLDTRTEEDFPTRSLTRTFQISNTQAYTYYRLNILSNGNNNNTQFAEWELWQRKTQVISFGDIPVLTYGDDPAELAVSAGSGLPVTLEIVSGNATVNDDGILTVLGAGEVIIRATQAGDENYFPAPAVEKTIMVAKAAQQIHFPAITNQLRTATLQPGASSSAGLPVSYYVASGPALVAGSTISFNGEGEVVLKAVQQGNENYLAADTAEQRFIVYGTENKTDQFRIVLAPNPTRGPLSVLILNKKHNGRYTFRLCDHAGRVISSCILAGNDIASVAFFNLSNQPAGTYYLYASNGTEQLVRIILKL